MRTLSVRECLRFGWDTFRTRPWFFVLLTLAVVAISAALNFLLGIIVDGVGEMTGETFAGALEILVSVLIDATIGIGVTAAYLAAHDRVEGLTLSVLWHPQHFLPFLAAWIGVGVLVLLGFILLIVPGIILAIVLSFTLYLVLERRMTAIPAMKESARLTKGNRWNLFLLTLACTGINILGILALVVGLFVSIPVTMLAMVHAYRVLEREGGTESETIAPTPPEVVAA